MKKIVVKVQDKQVEHTLVANYKGDEKSKDEIRERVVLFVEFAMGA